MFLAWQSCVMLQSQPRRPLRRRKPAGSSAWRLCFASLPKGTLCARASFHITCNPLWNHVKSTDLVVESFIHHPTCFRWGLWGNCAVACHSRCSWPIDSDGKSGKRMDSNTKLSLVFHWPFQNLYRDPASLDAGLSVKSCCSKSTKSTSVPVESQNFLLQSLSPKVLTIVGFSGLTFFRQWSLAPCWVVQTSQGGKSIEVW